MRANPAKRILPAEEAALWARAMRDVTPLSGRRVPPVALPKPPPEPVQFRHKPAEPSPLAPAIPSRDLRQQPLDTLTGLDRASAQRLRRGRREIEGRLDLHGMTQGEAHQALHRFVETSQMLGRRCVLVITGRGSFGGGILKQVVPRWLAEPALRRHVVAIAPAQPRHGGNGALYLLLKRVRAEAG